MPEIGGQEKTERPTARRRGEARAQGQVVVSQDFVGAAIFFAMAACLVSFGASTMRGLSGGFTWSATRIARAAGEDLNGITVVRDVLFRIASIVAPFTIVLASVAIGLTVAQTGWLLTGKRLKFDLNRLNPINGAGRLFSAEGAARFLFALIKVSVLGFVVYRVVIVTLAGVEGLVLASPVDFCEMLMALVRRVFLTCAIALAVIGLFDYGWRKFQHERRLMMTRQEVKEEIRMQEGDPAVKRRIRQAQRALMRRLMMKEVKKADVVVTNPHRIAVALLYDRKRSLAPRVVAKGMNLLAEKIKDDARRAGVPIVENKPVARALYRMVEVGGEIPEKLFVAVAEILAMVYRLKKRAV